MDALDELIEREGGFVDHPADRGGPTKYGITQQTLSTWLARPATREDVENLTHEQARAIYLNRYLRAPGIDRIRDERLRNFVLDAAVLHGPTRAIRFLQEAAGVTVDGALGPQTRNAVNAGKPEELLRRVAVARLLHFHRIVVGDASQAVFLRGWFNRIVEQL